MKHTPILRLTLILVLEKFVLREIRERSQKTPNVLSSEECLFLLNKYPNSSLVRLGKTNLSNHPL